MLFNAGLLLNLFVPPGREIIFFNDFRLEPLNTFFKLATQLGEPTAFVVAFILLLFVRYRFSALILIGGLIIIPVSYQLKDKIGKDRPVVFFEKTGQLDSVVFVPGVKLYSGRTSFPSGHTTAAFALYSLLAGMALIMRKKKTGLFLAGLGFLVALSRIFLVQHFLTDVLAGCVLGLSLSALVWWINWRFLNGLSWLDKAAAFNR
ncbi:MAG: phosphatase PAP2 family protein [Saprospiraceae bacterium]